MSSVIKIVSSLFITLYFISFCYISAQPRMINGISVPDDFPLFVPTININPYPGKIFTSNVSGNTFYIIIYENDGTPYFYKKVDTYSVDFKVQPNGLLSRHLIEDDRFSILDSEYNEVTTYEAQNNYITDFHDFLITEQGNVLLIAIKARTVDMSQIVLNGQPNATVADNLIQELDADKNLIFEWDSKDYFNIEDAVNENLLLNVIDYIHINSVALDYDGHILISSRHQSECTKINRQTGEIIWRLGGVNNQFTFINEETEISYQHSFYPVEGTPGNYLIFDNGNYREQFTRVVEYQIDEQNHTAEKVWEYRNTPDYYTKRAGNSQRLPNGNTLINFGLSHLPKVVEVAPDGTIQYQANFSPQLEAHKTYKFDWEGVMDKPYLITEPLTGGLRLLFNKFGDNDVVSYNVYGGTAPEPTTIIANTTEPWYEIDLRQFTGYSSYYFRVTALNSADIESEYSNSEFADLTQLDRGNNSGVLGNSLEQDAGNPVWVDSQNGFEYALSFDGIDDYVNCGNEYSLQIAGSEITLEAWININDFGTIPDEGVIIGKNNGEEDTFAGYLLSCRPNGIIYFSIGNNSLYEIETSANTVQLNQWHHVAATFGGDVLRIYIDGNLTAEKNVISTAIGNASNVNLNIGAPTFRDGNFFNGIIDEVKIWNVERAQTEIQATMNSELTPEMYTDVTTGLAAYWPFNEGEGETVEDLAVDDNLVVNGYFTNQKNYWDLVTDNGAAATGSITDENQYLVEITNGNDKFEDVQLKQSNILIIKNNSYTLEFDAWSESTKYINIKLANPDTPWLNYADIGFQNITSTIKHFECKFTMEEASDAQTDLIFEIGGSDINIYLDNVRLTNDIVSSVSSDSDWMSEFKLLGNYPNPFNPSTTIEYKLPELSNVTISVFDVLGQLIKTIFSGTQNGGLHKIHFSGSNLSSGVYIYTIEANSIITGRKFRDSNKMLLLK